MRQLSQNLRSGKLAVDQVPLPQAQAGQVLVQTVYSIISAGTERSKIETGRKSLVGKALARPDQVRQVIQSVNQIGLSSTLEKVKTRLDARSPLGYSAAGVVISVGTGVDEFRPGDRIACGGATAAHAEVIAVPRHLCAVVPEGVGLDTAAFTTVGAIAIQGVRQSDARLGECVVVIGLGLLGQLTIQILKAAGCTVIGFDLDQSRCDLAVRTGADVAVTNEEALKSHAALHTASHGADAIIITAGTSSNRPVELAGELGRERGRVVVVGAVGLTLPREPYYHKELAFTISRSYGPGRYDPTYEDEGLDYPYGYVRWTEQRNMSAFLALAAAGKINVAPLITHRFKLEQADAAYGLISGQVQEPCLGVLFEYEQPVAAQLTRIEINPTGTRSTLAGRVGISVVGAGNFACSMLLPHLLKNDLAVLRGVATLTPLESRDVAERFGFAYAATSPREILDDSDVSAVIIATRHDSHADLVVQALRSGKAIHVEKPLALSLEELDQVIASYVHHESDNPPSANLAEKSFLMVGFNRRFAPMVQRIAGFFVGRREPLAMTYRINAGYIPLDHWTQNVKQGGGRIIGEVCHFVDLFQFFANSKVKSVFAQALPNGGRYHDDNVAISVSLHDGSVGTILYVANGDKGLSKERLEVFGDGKIAILEDFVELTLIHGGKKKVSQDGARDKGHRAEMIAWIAAIQNGKAEPVPFADAVTATRATFAILTSLAEGRVVAVE